MNNMRRRALLTAAPAAALAAPLAAPAVAQGAKPLRFVPQANLTVLDPTWTTAYVTRNHAYMIYDTLFAVNQKGEIKPHVAYAQRPMFNGLDQGRTISGKGPMVDILARARAILAKDRDILDIGINAERRANRCHRLGQRLAGSHRCRNDRCHNPERRHLICPENAQEPLPISPISPRQIGSDPLFCGICFPHPIDNSTILHAPVPDFFMCSVSRLSAAERWSCRPVACRRSRQRTGDCG